jgi:hypothetical protein
VRRWHNIGEFQAVWAVNSVNPGATYVDFKNMHGWVSTIIERNCHVRDVGSISTVHIVCPSNKVVELAFNQNPQRTSGFTSQG